MPPPNPFASWQYRCEAPLQAGASCENDQACATGLHCSPATKKCERPGGLDATCASDRGCVPEFACRARYGAARCFTIKCDASGNNCQQDQPTSRTCNPGETCNSNELCVGGDALGSFCTRRAAAGASCENYSNGGCAAGYVCQIGTARCVSAPRLGEPCPMPFDRSCSSDGTLVCLSDNAGTSTCRAPVAIGQQCDSGGNCVKGAHCNLRTLKCEANRKPGDDCPNGNECGEAPFDRQIGVECVQGTCEDTSKAGAKCWPNDPSQCTGGRVCRKN